MTTLIDAIPDIDAESPDEKKLESGMGRLEFKDVHFRYRTSSLVEKCYPLISAFLATRLGVRVLRSLDFTIEPGTYVAIVGASGSG